MTELRVQSAVEAGVVMSMSQRYSRAVKMTAPKLSAVTPGVAVDGYWLDNHSYFFRAERVDPSLSHLVAVPSIADAQTGRVDEVMSLEALATLLSMQAEGDVTPALLCSAGFEMPDRHTLAVSVAGQDYLVDVQAGCVVAARASHPIPALYSPNGRHSCFVKGFDIWLRDLSSGAERPLTTDGAAHHRYGQQPETCLSALSYRKCPIPMGLWSADSQWFLTHRIDEQALPESSLVQHAPPGGGRPVLHTFKYAIPNDAVPMATYFAIHVATGQVVSFDDFPATVMAYSPFVRRTVWLGRDNTVWSIRLDRYCKRAELLRLDLVSGHGSVVLEETAPSGYLEFHPIVVGTPNVRTLAGSDEVIWFSERDGWSHLYLYDGSTGALKNQITQGEWLVRDIVHIDETSRQVYFLAAGIDADADPACRALCSVNLDGSGFEVLLTHDDGDVFVVPTEPCGLDQDRPFRFSYAHAGLSSASRFALVRYASVREGNRTEIVELCTRRSFTIASARPRSDQVRSRHFTALAADGVTRLHGTMFLPSDFDERRSYPLVDHIYPGPQILQQPQSFFSVNAAQSRVLAELGFVTIMLDTRRMSTGSRATHQVGYGGPWEEPQLADHAAVMRQLCKQFSFIDGERIGAIGQSAGGTATVRALCDYGDIFKVGIAACGVYDTKLYSTHWSDKYCGPTGCDGWIDRTFEAVAHKLTGKLLLICGDMDENVHLSQTLSLVNVLVRGNRDFDLLIVPNAGHNVLMESVYAQRRVWDYFVRHLLGETPPANFQISFGSNEAVPVWKTLWRECRQ